HHQQRPPGAPRQWSQDRRPAQPLVGTPASGGCATPARHAGRPRRRAAGRWAGPLAPRPHRRQLPLGERSAGPLRPRPRRRGDRGAGPLAGRQERALDGPAARPLHHPAAGEREGGRGQALTPTTRIAAAALLLLAATALAATAETPAPRVPNPQAERRLRDRERWQRSILASREATPEQKAESWGELANLFHAYALLSAAEPAYEKAQALAPGDFRWPYYLGQLHRARSEGEESLASFRRAALRAPRDVPSQVRLGEVLLDQGRLEEARGTLARALALDPRCAAAHFSLGVLANAGGDRS